MRSKYLTVLITLFLLFNFVILRATGILDGFFSNVNFSLEDDTGIAIAAVLLGLIVLLAIFIKIYLDRDLNRLYKKLVNEYFLNMGLKSAAANRLSKSDQKTIKKFIEITEVLSKHKN